MKPGLAKKISSYADFALFTLPALFSVVMVTLIPFALNAYYCFFDWNGVSRNMNFVGLDNFKSIFTTDTIFMNSLIFTAKFTVFFVIFVNIVSILIAYALSNNAKISTVFRSFYFIPYIISLVAISLIWKCILGPGFNNLFESTGVPFFEMSWLGSSSLVFFTVTFLTIWQNVGFYMVIYIAGFMGIPPDILEAASVDGATGITRFFRIQIPLLMPSITISVFTSITYAFKLFDIVLVLTRGGPGGATTSVAYDIYTDAFANGHYGEATAKSLIFFVAVLLVTAVQLKFFKSKEVNY